MELGGRWSNKLKGKAIEDNVLCYCGIPAKISQAWTEKNPGRRFYGCEKYKSGSDCKFFKWFDEEEAFGWQKKALIEARNEIREKHKTIMELRKIISKLQSELVKKEEAEEDIINAFLKLRSCYCKDYYRILKIKNPCNVIPICCYRILKNPCNSLNIMCLV
ncbi:hypothetical protein BRARA_G03403 [Brassica rapa]|uniref:GRF-type domain-containing protein n=1 Tax=Brassica campestris TaxID=3711 RepID=A0A397YS27_BRACM|nr:hypothetical protein BRARA_G03403 [Brassica rapa]